MHFEVRSQHCRDPEPLEVHVPEVLQHCVGILSLESKAGHISMTVSKTMTLGTATELHSHTSSGFGVGMFIYSLKASAPRSYTG